MNIQEKNHIFIVNLVDTMKKYQIKNLFFQGVMKIKMK
jgi:hypothetical protein